MLAGGRYLHVIEEIRRVGHCSTQVSSLPEGEEDQADLRYVADGRNSYRSAAVYSYA